MEELSRIKKGFKSYLQAKKHLNKDNNKSFMYFQQTLKYLNNISDSKYKKIIDETTEECDRLILETLNINDKEDIYDDINIFDLIKTGNKYDLVKINNIDFEKLNEEGLNVLHYCIKMGDMGILKHLLKKGGKIDSINGNNNTLLEYACLEKDPNAIQFICDHGGDMKKHLYFRDNTKNYKLKKNDIDLAIIMKIILNNSYESNEFDFILNYIDEDLEIGLNDITVKELIKFIPNLFDNEESKQTYKNIINEELDNVFIKKLGCPQNKLDILLINLVPFIKYPFNISSDFIVSNEIKYLILSVIRKKSMNNNLLKKYIDRIWNSYIKENLLTENYLGILTSQWMSKLKLKYV